MAAEKLDPYFRAAHVLHRFSLKEGSLKRLCFGDQYKRKKKLYALAVETLKHKCIIDKIFSITGILTEGQAGYFTSDIDIDLCKNQSKLHKDVISMKQTMTKQSHLVDCSKDQFLKYVLVYEALFGKGIGINDKTWRGWIKEHQTSFKTALASLGEEETVAASRIKTEALPRYVRVNTIKKSSMEVIESLHGMGFVETEKVENLSEEEFHRDEIIPDLIVLQPGLDLQENQLYIDGCIIIQDKASCLPAFILDPKPGATVVDACAAPGNKTSHLASIMKNKGKIYAVDRDPKRIDIMKTMLAKAGVTCVNYLNMDFLKLDPSDNRYRKVEYMLVDPSCSGSGIVSRLDGLLDDGVSNVKDDKRLKSLSGFQTAALSHALSFPAVKRVVYSTCSVHREENEAVVERVLSRVKSRFKLVNILSAWKTRGLPDTSVGPYCVRASPEATHTNGFFVAMFERKDDYHFEFEKKHAPSIPCLDEVDDERPITTVSKECSQTENESNIPKDNLKRESAESSNGGYAHQGSPRPHKRKKTKHLGIVQRKVLSKKELSEETNNVKNIASTEDKEKSVVRSKKRTNRKTKQRRLPVTHV